MSLATAPLLLAACEIPSAPNADEVVIHGLRHDLTVGARVQLTVTDPDGSPIAHAQTDWWSSDRSVAMVSQDGLVNGLSPGEVVIEARVGEGSAELPMTVRHPAPAFASVVAGGEHTCALTPDGEAYCWGRNDYGQLGTETADECDSDYGRSPVPCSVATAPAAQGRLFETLEAGVYHTCGLTTAGSAYCWGRNDSGQLGDGTHESGPEARPVVGAHVFKALSAAHGHTCGLTASGTLMCWGSNGHGGLGPDLHRTLEPVAVAHEHRFSLAATAIGHTCGTTLDGKTLCWGRNDHGQLGTDAVPSTCGEGGEQGECAHIPLEAQTMVTFGALDANAGSTCGLDDIGRAYCWGLNDSGQLGDGTRRDRAEPEPVAGNRRFSLVTAGFRHTCGLEIDGDAYCWGRDAGTFGAGRDVPSIPAPAWAAPGLRFTSLSAGFEHTCGVTAAGAAYCWGRNWQGQLGNGKSGLDQRETTPVRVSGLAFGPA